MPCENKRHLSKTTSSASSLLFSFGRCYFLSVEANSHINDSQPSFTQTIWNFIMRSSTDVPEPALRNWNRSVRSAPGARGGYYSSSCWRLHQPHTCPLVTGPFLWSTSINPHLKTAKAAVCSRCTDEHISARPPRPCFAGLNTFLPPLSGGGRESCGWGLTSLSRKLKTERHFKAEQCKMPLLAFL